MGKEQCITRRGHNLFEISSLVQKAIRRGDEEMACYAAREMSDKYRGYLWKRLLTTSAEDCYGLVTGPVLDCYESNDIDKALSIMLPTWKNRDADFFACNLLNSRDRIELTPLDDSYIEQDVVLTKNGHDLFMLLPLLEKSLYDADDKLAGYISKEIYSRYRAVFWRAILQYAKRLCNSVPIREEVKSLKYADDLQKEGHRSSIYIAKAIVILIKERLGVNDLVAPERMIPVSIERFTNEIRRVPSYAYDCHTLYGKRLGKTKRDFVLDEQRGLRPHKQGMYDDCPWDRFFDFDKNGYNNDLSFPEPSEEIMKEVEQGTYVPRLF